MIADAARAGELKQALRFSFPAATTTVTPALVSRCTAESSMLDVPPPKLIFKTACDLEFTFCGLRIQSIPATTPAMVPEPLHARTRTATNLAFFATPYEVPAAVDAT